MRIKEEIKEAEDGRRPQVLGRTPAAAHEFLATTRDRDRPHRRDRSWPCSTAGPTVSLEVGTAQGRQPRSPCSSPSGKRRCWTASSLRNPGPLPESSHLRAVYREILSSSRTPPAAPEGGLPGARGHLLLLRGHRVPGQQADVRALPQPGHPGRVRGRGPGRGRTGGHPPGELAPGHRGPEPGPVPALPTTCTSRPSCTAASATAFCLSSGQDMADVRGGLLPPQPLAQCGAWLKAHLPHGPAIVPVESPRPPRPRVAWTTPGPGRPSATVGNARLAEMLRPEHPGQTASRTCPTTGPGSWSSDPSPRPRPRATGTRPPSSSPLPDRPGALASDILNAPGPGGHQPDQAGIPAAARARIWKYVFFADLECDLNRSNEPTPVHAGQDPAPRPAHASASWAAIRPGRTWTCPPWAAGKEDDDRGHRSSSSPLRPSKSLSHRACFIAPPWPRACPRSTMLLDSRRPRAAPGPCLTACMGAFFEARIRPTGQGSVKVVPGSACKPRGGPPTCPRRPATWASPAPPAGCSRPWLAAGSGRCSCIHGSGPHAFAAHHGELARTPWTSRRPASNGSRASTATRPSC